MNVLKLDELSQAFFRCRGHIFADFVGIEKRTLNNWLKNSKRRTAVLCLFAGIPIVQVMSEDLFVVKIHRGPCEVTRSLKELVEHFDIRVSVDSGLAGEAALALTSELVKNQFDFVCTVERTTLQQVLFDGVDGISDEQLLAQAVFELYKKKLHIDFLKATLGIH